MIVIGQAFLKANDFNFLKNLNSILNINTDFTDMTLVSDNTCQKNTARKNTVRKNTLQKNTNQVPSVTRSPTPTFLNGTCYCLNAVLLCFFG